MYLRLFGRDLSHSEEHKDLSDIAFDSLFLLSEDVESHGLGEGSALADCHDVSLSDSREGRGAVDGEVVVSLLESVVLFDVMEVISSDHDGSLLLDGDNDSLEESASDGHV